MKAWQHQLDMAEMSVTILELLTAAFAFCTLVRDAHARVQRSIDCHISSFIEVVHAPVGELDLGLIDHILVGSVLPLDVAFQQIFLRFN